MAYIIHHLLLLIVNNNNNLFSDYVTMLCVCVHAIEIKRKEEQGAIILANQWCLMPVFSFSLAFFFVMIIIIDRWTAVSCLLVCVCAWMKKKKMKETAFTHKHKRWKRAREDYINLIIIQDSRRVGCGRKKICGFGKKIDRIKNFETDDLVLFFPIKKTVL